MVTMIAATPEAEPRLDLPKAKDFPCESLSRGIKPVCIWNSYPVADSAARQATGALSPTARRPQTVSRPRPTALLRRCSPWPGAGVGLILRARREQGEGRGRPGAQSADVALFGGGELRDDPRGGDRDVGHARSAGAVVGQGQVCPRRRGRAGEGRSGACGVEPARRERGVPDATASCPATAAV